jgi:hypothetical protein
MVYVPLLVFVVLAVVIVGWRKGFEIAIAALFVCLIFDWFRFVDLRALPANLWHVLVAIASFPLYLVRNPSDWLPILVPLAVLIAALIVAAGLRRLATRRG